MKRDDLFGVACLGEVSTFPLCLHCHLWVMCGHYEVKRCGGGKECK
jgi:hypothetical protein